MLFRSFVIDFSWREATIRQFMASGAEASTKSAIATVEYYNEAQAVWDTLRFRLMLWPAHRSSPSEQGDGDAAGADGQAGAALPQHRMVLQLVGGSAASQVYTLSFHTVHPSYQVHIKVADHRTPIYRSREVFHKWHPLMASLRVLPSIRMLVRVKPDGSGPLVDMCGCC